MRKISKLGLVALAAAAIGLTACGGGSSGPVASIGGIPDGQIIGSAAKVAAGLSLKVPSTDVPDLALTPGVAYHVGTAQICVPGYASSVRNVSDMEKAQVYARYRVKWVPYQHEVDHLISLEIGGSNALRNLWPEPYAGRWGARTKDVLENRLHSMVCAGDLSLRLAQRQEASNWVAAYRRYVGGTPTNPGPGTGGGSGGSSAGGYYASRYPGASTIYCADDPGWKALSPTYRLHFQTFAQAHARFPGYHLHRPC